MTTKLKSILKTIYRSLRSYLSNSKINFVLWYNRFKMPHSLNIGGGPRFCKIGWYNLDAETGPTNPVPFKLSPDCRFPIPDLSLRLVYNSHNLEHLEPETVKQVLQETSRVLKKDGDLVIKMPDFEKVLEAWKQNDREFFEKWGIENIIHTWEIRGIPDTIDYRTAMIFCGFWNKEFGSHFALQKNAHHHPKAYHGPPAVDKEFLEVLFSNNSPSCIAARLRQFVINTEKDFCFNHQNAWSRKELKEQLARAGFYVETFNRDDIVSKYYSIIPAIDSMKEISMYCMARK